MLRWKGYDVLRVNGGGTSPGPKRWVWFYWWYPSGENHKHHGVPDLIIWGKGLKPFCFEVKRPGEKLKDEQELFREKVKGSMNVYRTESLEEAEEALRTESALQAAQDGV